MKAMRRMNDAQRIAKECVKSKKPDDGEFKSLVKGLGSMIIQNGVYGTIVFLEAKGKEHHKKVVNDFEKYLKEINVYKGDDFLSFLEETPDLPIIQDEILEFVNWYRRYVDIYINKGE